MYDILSLLYYAIPAGALIFFIVSLVRYIVAKNKNKKVPGTYSESQMKNIKTLLKISSLIAGVMAGVILGFFFLIQLFAYSM